MAEEMGNLIEEYILLSEDLLKKAEETLGEGDFLQASEKSWGSAAHLAKAVAEMRGWKHDSHRELFRVVERMVKETGDKSLRDLFLIASQLHINFYENWLPEEAVKASLERVKEFREKVKMILEKGGG